MGHKIGVENGGQRLEGGGQGAECNNLDVLSDEKSGKKYKEKGKSKHAGTQTYSQLKMILIRKPPLSENRWLAFGHRA